MDELTGVLERERSLLELLLHRLHTLRRLLEDGSPSSARFIALASSEVERAGRAVRETELHRALVVAQLARELSLQETEPTLRRLSDTAKEPWRTILREQGERLRDLAEEVGEVVSSIGRYAEEGVRS